MSTAAIILAGGRSSRLGTAKPDVLLGARSLLQRTLQAVHPRPAVVVGPSRLAQTMGPARGVTVVREHPPFGGPAAAIAAAIAELDRRRVPAARVLLLACDLVHPGPAAAALLSEPPGDVGLVLRDGAGQIQWLCSLYPSSLLRAAAGAARAGMSVAALLDALPRRELPVDSDLVTDIDTPGDLLAAREGIGS
jgi:molybdopterin-guanine dinucleotide biosynthesis protein A